MKRWLALGLCLSMFLAGCGGTLYKYNGKSAAEWGDVLKTGNESERSTALQALAEICKHDPQAASVLANGLKDKAVGNRMTTIQLLKGLGPNGKAAIPALKTAQLDSTKAVADEARKAIAEIETK